MPNRQSIILRRIGLMLAILALAYSSLRWGGNVVGAFNRSFRSPEVIESRFIEQLNAGSATEQRDRLLNTWRSGGEYGLTRVQHSVEGDPIQHWLIVSNRRATFVTDYTRDAHHGTRGYIVEHPVSLERNIGGDGNPFRAWFAERGSVYILCRMSGDRTRFF